jgi:hypothetical protein
MRMMRTFSKIDSCVKVMKVLDMMQIKKRKVRSAAVKENTNQN